MNGNVGISFALSFLIVAVVAVALYQPTALPPRPTSADPIEVTATAEPPSENPLPPLTPTVPATDVSPGPPSPSTASATAVPAREPARPRILATGPEPRPDPSTPAPEVRPISRRAAASAPRFRPPFTTAAAGETLADVARRVYGSAAAAHDLWLANRDHIERPDVPLPAGTLLRTP